tara:strand:+ start:9698 stop:9880 length:183 start_codon:yes stop_codon:yes gene_type:complete
MTLLYRNYNGIRAADRKIIRVAFTDANKKVNPTTLVRDSSDYTRTKRLIAKNKGYAKNKD